MLVLTSLFLLSACGGGSGTESTGSVTPTPSPTPTPAPTYIIPDYSRDFALGSSLGYTVNVNGTYFSSGSLLARDKSSFLYYYDDPERADFSFDGSTASWTAADILGRTPYMLFQKGSEILLLGFLENSLAKYVTVAERRTITTAYDTNGVYSPDYQNRIAIFGTPSSASDPLPTYLGYSGYARVSGGIAGSKSQGLTDVSGGTSKINWSYTPSARSIFGSIPLFVTQNSTMYQRGLLRADGQFDPATNSISGTLTDEENGFKGSFRGQMFGPERAELAIIFEFSRASDGSAYFGHYIGTR